MLEQQTFEGRRESLNQANKLVRSYTTLMEGLDKHRGKGQQKVTVEHVHVHQGGQAIVGNVTTGGGRHRKWRINPLRRLSPMNRAKRYRARSKRTGKPCQAPAVRG